MSPRDGLLTAERVQAVQDAARSVDWRVYDVVVTVPRQGAWRADGGPAPAGEADRRKRAR